MPAWIGELIAVLVLVVSVGATAVGLFMIAPGLALAVAGLTGGALVIGWLRRERPFPEVTAETEQRDLDETDPDDDGRMEVRPL